MFFSPPPPPPPPPPPGMSRSERLASLKQMVLEKLPEDNYLVLKFLVNFLSRVSCVCVCVYVCVCWGYKPDIYIYR